MRSAVRAALARLAIVRVLRRYTGTDCRGDVIAALTVAVMIIPQSMAYAMLAGLPPVYGLYASLVPLLAYPIFGTSHQLAFGIVALDMLIVASVLAEFDPASAADAAALAVTLAAMVGVIHLVLGLLRLGFISDFLSRPVVVGFTTAAPLLIGLSQLGNLTGVTLPRQQELIGLGWEMTRHLGGIHLISTGLGLGSILWLALGRRLWPRFPHALAVVIAGGLATWGLGLHGDGVAIVGAIDNTLPSPQLPAFEADTIRGLLSSAVTLAAVQIMIVMSLGRVLANRHGDEFYPNRELVALGTANLLGSLFRSVPVSVSFSRTAVNVEAGARTPLANAFAAVVVALCMLVATAAIAFIPRPALAAIIMVSAFSMISLRETRTIFTLHRTEGLIAVMTMLVTLLVGIKEGVLLGLLAALVDMLYRASRPRVAVLALDPATGDYHDIAGNPHLQPDPHHLVLRVDGAITFTNAEHIRRIVLGHLDAREGIERVIIDGAGINHIDATAIDAFGSLLDSLDRRRIPLYLTRIKGAARAVLRRGGLTGRIANDVLELDTDTVVDAIEAGAKSGDPGAVAPPGRSPSESQTGTH